MTREEILALEGLDLRKAVADAAGWVCKPEPLLGMNGHLDFAKKVCWFVNPDSDIREQLPAFESDIAAAWPLAEECGFTLTPTHALGWEVFQRTNGGNICGDICYIGTMSSQKWVFGRTAPRAICPAYLVAKEDAK